MKTWVYIIRENVFFLGGNRDHVPACLCHMLYCIVTSTKYNLAFFVAKRMELVTCQARSCILLLINMSERCERIMARKEVVIPLSLPPPSPWIIHHPSSSHHVDDDNDENDEGDFNEVRYASERHGSSFHASNAAEFNNFIVKSYLNDVSLGGYSFTWSNKYIDTPSRLKTEFYSQFTNRFSAPEWIRVPFDAHFPRRLDNDQSYDLESDVTNKEIKRAVGDYGFDKSPNPDGFTFDQEQSTFIKGRQIMEGPIILNEVISWCKSKKVQSLLFKVDFIKAFDSVRWDHIDDTLDKLGFGNKWRGWIRGCLYSSKASVLVIGSPTEEFLFHRDNLVPISHLLYDDDVMFIGNSLYGVGVRHSEVQSMADHYDCLANNLPFTHLGVKVGANMSRVNSWTIHGNDGAIDYASLSCYGHSVWKRVLKATARLKSKGVDLMEYCKIVIGIKETQSIELSQLLSSVILSLASDRWSWSLNGNGEFLVKSAREVINNHVLVTSSSLTRWSKVLPIKINVFPWRMFFDKIPTRTNLSKRGIDIPCILYPNYGNGVKSCNHLFFECSMAVDLFQLLGRW
ncbi:RNA-directed DNA polymerase, eukaryota, reverse transcriptase zinc-binding domain protein [Tanacetum coccineum]